MTEQSPSAACVFIGDDFTGASDTLATFARSGAKAKLFLEPPTVDECADLDAIGIATALRSMDAAPIHAECSRLGPLLAALGARFYHYKVCSTFDSSATIGSIGQAVTTLSGFLKPALTIIVGGQPSLGRYCHFGNLFARASDGKVYRIDRHPVMAHHPVTPMGEADLRLHLQQQGLQSISCISGVELDNLPHAVEARLHDAVAGGGGVFLMDAGQQSHIDEIGRMLTRFDIGRPMLLIGASSVAEMLCVNRAVLEETPRPNSLGMTDDHPVFVFAGSRSSVTAAQVRHATQFDTFSLPPAAVSSPALGAQLAALIAARLQRGCNVLVHLQQEADYGMSGHALAHFCAQFVSAVVRANHLSGVGVAGGDTSSLIVAELGIRSITHLADIDRGVAICAGDVPDHEAPLVLMLKGGQMGVAPLFDRFAEMCRSPALKVQSSIGGL